jgi:hypothetical protein
MPSARTVSARIWSVSARVVNRIRIKSCLARLGIRNFKSTLGKALERLETLRTPEGGLVPPNTLAELRRDLARLRLIIPMRIGSEAPGRRAQSLFRLGSQE